ncbi:hypothetical protein R1flu_011568 [Riccia fluitans]|uniref:mRNA guanylyltransferase n=1 Tax=Riccia fluitans TaxID=41844 RepID=A0ABD1Z8J9_9MARC
MDLNVAPPADEEEETVESGVEIERREGEERSLNVKKKREAEELGTMKPQLFQDRSPWKNQGPLLGLMFRKAGWIVLAPGATDLPQHPEWKRPNGEATQDEEDNDNDNKKAGAMQSEDGGPLAIFKDYMLEDEIPQEHQLEMQTNICSSLGLPTQHHDLRFPGSQPVSLDRKRLQLLRQRYYYTTWKADGTRYMLFLRRDGCYLINSNSKFRRDHLRFPTRLDSKKLHHDTLLDGEMVIDTLPGSRSKEKKHCGKLVYQYDMEKFSVRKKDFWLLSTTKELLVDFIQKLPHKADGLIFQDWNEVYVCGTDQGLLKWKYAGMNSVDFLVLMSHVGQLQYSLHLVEGGEGETLRQLQGTRVTFPEDQDVSLLDGKIIECLWNPEKSQWEFKRLREGKVYPNAWHVYENIIASIHDKITEEVLIKEIREICLLPLYAKGTMGTER